ncbi:TRAP transporter small permease subunit [Paenirhodobacter populi]|uniref:TRAP transporter small permease protein n=1 Tax=Paenirhodobacter populi TaxID=2306993 RepID=A0A443IJR3_9RHOB|nr:TRAP transporter small permease [Sinirhodobacter populi]RWR04851.1 TRAP transporter small permease [Sinirhodobacter populi]
MERYVRILGIIFGIMMISLSIAVTAETILRKFFSFSLGGIDELAGYAIAIAAPLTFTVALVERSHIRINQLTQYFPRKAQAVLDVVSAVSLMLLAVYFFWFTVQTVLDTQIYRSIAQTPWATPLIWPQTIWLIASITFPVAAVILSVRAVRLLVRRDWRSIHKEFGTISPEEELHAELEDLKRREAEIHASTKEAVQ